MCSAGGTAHPKPCRMASSQCLQRRACQHGGERCREACATFNKYRVKWFPSAPYANVNLNYTDKTAFFFTIHTCVTNYLCYKDFISVIG